MISTYFLANITCEGSLGKDKYALWEMSSYKIIFWAMTEVKNVILAGREDVIGGICSMICTSQSCVGFSPSIDSGNSCHLYSKLEFAQDNHTAPALEVKQKLYLR